MMIFLLLVFVVIWLIVRSRDQQNRAAADSELRSRIYALETALLKLHSDPPAAVSAKAVEALHPQSTQRVEGSAPEQVVPPQTAMRPAHVEVSAGTVTPVLRPSQRAEGATKSVPEAPEPAKSQRGLSLEERLGSNWLNKLGIVILVFGVAFFLAYQLKNLGPAGKTLVGFAVSATLLMGGLALERREKYRIFARAGIGGGWALTFFTTYAMYHLHATHILNSQATDSGLMLLVAAGMVAHSLRYSSQAVTGLGFLLAFSTVTISSDEGFSLPASALLAIGLVVVTSRKHWAQLEFAGLIALYANHFVWLHRVLNAPGVATQPFPEFFYSSGLLFLDWLIFRVAYVARVPKDRDEDLMMSVTAVLNTGGLLGLLSYQSAHPEWAFWLLLALGAAEMLMAFIARARRRSAFIVLSTIASGLLLAAIPYRFHGPHWSLLWLLEAEVLFVTGLRMREVVFRRLGMIAGFAAAAQLGFGDLLPVIALRATHADDSHHWSAVLALLGGAVIFWFNAEAAPRRWPALLSRNHFDELDGIALRLTSFLGLMAATSGLWVALPETATVIAWMLLALLLIEVGIRRNFDDLRLQAFILLTLTFLRIFLVNLQAVSSRKFFNPRVYITIPLVVAFLWAYERLQRYESAKAVDRIAGLLSCCFGCVAMVALVYVEVRPQWVVIAWALIILVLTSLSWWLKRRIFLAQGLVLAVAVFMRALVFNLFGAGYVRGSMTASPVFCIGVATTILFLTLPIAFRLRRQTKYASDAEWKWLLFAVDRPEQMLFFTPLLLVTIMLAHELRAGLITVAWSGLGVAVFLLALLVRERSYRLAGLGLLLLGVGKILLIDIWNLAPTDRYITLIVTGIALLAVSFLYTRYREVILKFL